MDWGLTVPPFVFNPVFSFQSITAPEISLETEDFAEGNYYFKRHLISGGEISNITLQRGASFYDAEFWNWITAAVKGEIASLIPPRMGGHRRNLLLVQYTGYSLSSLGNAADESTDGGAMLSGIADLAEVFNFGQAAWIPARAWMLFGCLPNRYKVAGDFDATAGEVSIMELDLCIDRMEEFAMTAF